MPMECKIKICGLQSLEDIEIINKYQEIAYGGFIFAESKRKITVEKAAELKKAMRSDIKAVGVFVDMTIEKINEIAEAVGLDIIQLHSHETLEDCKNANRPVWKMISVKDEKSVEQEKDFPTAQGILFDTYLKGMTGGTGEKFNWNFVLGMPEKRFTILAGGLTPENIQNAMITVKPQVIDVNSGVETEGRKDAAKIEDLIRRFRDVNG